MGGSAGVAVDGRAQARMWLADPGVGPSVVVEPGIRLGRDGAAVVAGLGVAWDVALPGPERAHRLRLGGQLQTLGFDRGAGVFTVGWAWGPPPVPEPEPEPEPMPELVRQFPDGARIWLPHPVCRWVTEDELPEVLATVPADQRAHVYEAAHAVLFTDVGGLEDAELAPAPTQGALLVVGMPGDRVRVGEREVSAGGDGVVQLTVPEGTVEAVVVGGGRRAVISSAVTVGHGTWVRVDEPEPTLVEFELGRAELTPDARELLQRLVDAAGGWSFELQGGFSPEGNRSANIALADRRAEAVRVALSELGLSDERIRVIASAVPEDASDAAARRVCTIHPRSAVEVTP